jgi:hypothetical protein
VIFPGFLIPAAFIGFIYVKLGIGYLNTGRDLRRMESNSRSPIFSGFAELLDGEPFDRTIRRTIRDNLVSQGSLPSERSLQNVDFWTRYLLKSI